MDGTARAEFVWECISENTLVETEAAIQVEGMYKAASHTLLENGARVVIMGATGTGKTSVRNAAFKDTQGRVSHGVPCTQQVEEFAPTKECPVYTYDTKGFEPLSDNQDIFDGLKALKNERMAAAKKHDPQSPQYHSERLHAVWWVTAERFEPDCAKRVYETFGEEIPIFVAINKCDKDADEVDEIVSMVKTHCPWAKQCIPIVATPKNGPLKKQCPSCHSSDIMVNEKRGYFICNNDTCDKSDEKQDLDTQYGIPDLLSSTVEYLPALVAHSFLVAQKEYLTDLDTTARNRIIMYTSLATAIGASPIPLSDFPFLVANEYAMFANLAAVYGLKVDPACVKQVMLSLTSMSAGALVGLGLGSCLKLIPGLGSVLGGASSAVIAGAVTSGIGFTVRELLRRVRKLAVFGEVTEEHFRQVMKVDEMEALFKSYFQKARDGVRNQ